MRFEELKQQRDKLAKEIGKIDEVLEREREVLAHQLLGKQFTITGTMRLVTDTWYEICLTVGPLDLGRTTIKENTASALASVICAEPEPDVEETAGKMITNLRACMAVYPDGFTSKQFGKLLNLSFANMSAYYAHYKDRGLSRKRAMRGKGYVYFYEEGDEK